MEGYAPPEGETWEVFHDRVDRTWEAIERHWVDHFKDVSETRHFAVVSHGLFLRSLIERRLLSEAQIAEHGDEHGGIVMANTALTVVRPGGQGMASPRHTVELIACTAHLDSESAHDADSIVGI